jgi:hypothetical protein
MAIQELPPVPRALGLASVALGIPPLLAPGRFDRAIGVEPDDSATRWTRLVGVQELGAAAGILALEAPRPIVSVWSRVAGDVAHLAMLGAAFARKRERADRLAAAMAFVVACGVVDTVAALRLGQAPAKGLPPKVREAVTIRKPRDEVRRFWNEFDFATPPLKGSSADADFVAFDPAPGDRGTEVKVELERGLGAAVKDELRRFKQITETGVIARSEAVPEGQVVLRRLKQRPAQPLPGVGSPS